MKKQTENSKNKDKKKDYNSDITEEDLQAIGDEGLRADSKGDRYLMKREKNIDFEGKDLDIPNRDKRAANRSRKLTDEENTLFGQGGERNENLEAPEASLKKKEQA